MQKKKRTKTEQNLNFLSNFQAHIYIPYFLENKTWIYVKMCSKTHTKVNFRRISNFFHEQQLTVIHLQQSTLRYNNELLH